MTMLTRPEGPESSDLHVTRRGFAALVAAGYAAAAVGADAAPIATPSDGLALAMVTMPGGLPGYVARPAGNGRHPVVIVVNEVFGLHEYIRDICRRFARLGYVAIAPEFFFRNDPGNSLASTTDFAVIKRIVGAAGNDQVMGDVGTTLDWLAAQPFVDARRLAITGFCWGGGVVWMAAARFPQLKAGVAWYGRLAPPKPGEPVTEVRKYPLEIVGDLKAPVLGLYGGLDKGIPASDVAGMNAALAAAGKTGSRLKLYPDAEHGFHADYRPSYNAVDAADGWSLLLAHFKANGVGPGQAGGQP